MTTFDQFSNRCKMRHDFADQIQVRYSHTDGEHYDTWVSGTEAVQRLEAIEAEKQLESLNRLTPQELRLVLQSLPDATRNMIRRSLRDSVADRLESTIGGNLIGDALSDAVRGRAISTEAETSAEDRWLALMRYEPFRRMVIELAWIALEGSFSDLKPGTEPDDWL